MTLQRFKMMLAGGLLALVLSPVASAQTRDATAMLQESVSKAVACRGEFGDDWDQVVRDALDTLEAHLLEQDPDMSKVDLDVAYTEALEGGKTMKMTPALRAYCEQAMAAGG
ncbi:MAG: hypothetical protein RSA54_14940 [Glutamicibacter sp.]|uniref:hypothetical protein n=1 Tax=Stenotrophomonas sp. TaxID=69392 RepID=UPI002FCC0F02